MKKLIFALALLLLSNSVYAQTSGMVCEYWMGATLSDPQQLVDSPDMLGPATSTMTRLTFVAQSNLLGPFVSRCKTAIAAPVAGNYTFWIAANRAATLWISTSPDGFSGSGICKVSTTLPTPAPLQWTRKIEQRSSLLGLSASTYYLQVVYIAVAGSVNHMAVGWQLPTGVYERPIPGSRIGVIPTVTLSADKTSIEEGEAASLTWTSINAFAPCVASATPAYQYWVGDRTLSGEQYITPLENTVVTLTCLGSAGATTSVSVALSVSPAEVVNPTTVQFDPSLDHAVLLGTGEPSVSGYILNFHLLGAVLPFQTLSLQKPSPNGEGKIEVNFVELAAQGGVLISWPIAVGRYQATVTAYGPNGVGISDFSNRFTIR